MFLCRAKLPMSIPTTDRQHLPGEHLDRHVIDDTRASDLPAEVVSLDDGRCWRKMLLPAWGAYSNS